jgi:hypothetical protein
MAIGIQTSYHLGQFMETMLNKRKLEYEAAYNRYKADVATGEAIGKGIESIGGAVGAIGQGIGGYMKQSALDKSAMAIGREEGVPLTSTGFGAADELKQRMAAGQFKGNEGMTPYQQSQSDIGWARVRNEVQRINDARDKSNEATSAAARRQQSESMTKMQGDVKSYYAQTAENSHKMWNADNPQDFATYAQNQKELNIVGRKAGVPEDQLQWVPDKWVPPGEQPAYNFYQAKEAFAQGRSRPGDIGAASQRYNAAMAKSREGAPTDEQGNPILNEPEYGNAPGQIRPPTYSRYPAGQEPPPGAVPVGPGFNQPKGFKARYNGRDYIFDGGDWLLPVLQ